MDGTPRRRPGLEEVATALGMLRLTAWWWMKTGKLPSARVDSDGPWWEMDEVYAAVLRQGMADRVEIVEWPDPSAPSEYLGAEELDGAVAMRWMTELGMVALIWPLGHERGHRRRLDAWTNVLYRAGASAVLQVAADFGIGPRLFAVRPGLPAGRSRHYGPWWHELSRVLGQPVPYWESHLTEARFVRAWQPGAESIVVPAVPDLQVAPLLRLAATYDAADPTSQVLVNLVRVAQSRVTDASRQMIGLAGEAPEGSISIAARPVAISRYRDRLIVLIFSSRYGQRS
jgi:hypothetical protein